MEIAIQQSQNLFLEQEISLLESLFGFDEDFAERIKFIWSEYSESKLAFKYDLQALNDRWSFSLFVEGAHNSHDGLAKTLMNQTITAVAGVGLGTLLLKIHSQMIRIKPKDDLIAMIGLCSILMGLAIPAGIFAERKREAKNHQFKAIVDKNFDGLLSPIDCKRLTQALIWAENYNVRFDMNNDHHLRGINLKNRFSY